MTHEETKKIIELLASGRQSIDVFDEIAFRKVTANHTMQEVVAAIAELRTHAAYVNPSDLRDELEKDGSADVWPAVADLITAGALRSRLDPGAFPSDRAYRAARSIVTQLMSGTPHSNAKAFAAAYKQTPAVAAPKVELEAAPSAPQLKSADGPVDELGRRRILAAARAALPERDDSAG